MNSDLFENLRLELRRGCLILAVLAQLRTERYGYVLRKALADLGMAIDENTLYPLLRRLESQGLLVSQWRVDDGSTSRLMRAFYAALSSGAGNAEALRAAQLQMLSADMPQSPAAHPFTWAGFQLIGNDLG